MKQCMGELYITKLIQSVQLFKAIFSIFFLLLIPLTLCANSIDIENKFYFEEVHYPKKDHPGGVTDVEFSPLEGSFEFFSSGWDGYVKGWNWSTQKKLYKLDLNGKKSNSPVDYSEAGPVHKLDVNKRPYQIYAAVRSSDGNQLKIIDRKSRKVNKKIDLSATAYTVQKVSNNQILIPADRNTYFLTTTYGIENLELPTGKISGS